MVTTEKGRNTLMTSSLERQDGLYDEIKNTTPLRIHADCRKQYTRKSSIASAKRKSTCLEENDAPLLRSGVSRTFDIKTDCLFCSESIMQDNKLSSNRKKAVSNVETLEFQASILKRAQERQDKWGNETAERVQHAHDLVAAEAKYHRQCAQTFLKRPWRNETNNSDNNSKEKAFNLLCDFLDDNDECQYPLQELLERMTSFLDGNEGYSVTYLERKLKSHYGDEIVITSIPGKSSVVSFRDKAHKILHEKWVTDKVFDANSQTDRIIDMAASIILNDIRLTVYDCDEYTTLETTENGEALIPSSLKRFLHKLVDGKGKKHTVSDRKCTSIAHAIIAASRPRSFVSPLLLGIAV